MDYNFPCKTCDCPAYLHFVSITDKDKALCIRCYNGYFTEARMPGVLASDCLHAFVGDNLSFLEIRYDEEKV